MSLTEAVQTARAPTAGDPAPPRTGCSSRRGRSHPSSRGVRSGLRCPTPNLSFQLKMILIKCCDISNEVRPMEVAEPWVDCLLEEYFMQVRAPRSGPVARLGPTRSGRPSSSRRASRRAHVGNAADTWAAVTARKHWCCHTATWRHSRAAARADVRANGLKVDTQDCRDRRGPGAGSTPASRPRRL